MVVARSVTVVDMTNTDTTQTSGEQAHPLVRIREGRIIAGVATGVARRLDVPLWLIRVGFVVLAFFGGFGLALYLAGWLLIRDETETEPIASSLVKRVDGAAGWVGVGLVGLAVLIFLDGTGILPGDLAGALVLGVIGVLLYRGELGSGSKPSPSDDIQPDQPATASASEENPTMTTETPTSTVEQPEARSKTVTVTAPPPPTPRPPRESSKLTPLTFAVGFIILGVVGMFDVAMSDFNPAARHYWSIGLTITGLALVIGAWFGRARGLIALGVILVPIVVASPIAELDVSGSVGERNLVVAAVADVAPLYELGVGSMVLDLSRVDFDGQTVETSAEVGLGELIVLVPRGVAVEVSGEAGIGEVDLFGRTSNGVGVDRSESRDGDSGTLVIDLSVGIGTVEVRNVAARAIDGMTSPDGIAGITSLDNIIIIGREAA